MYYVALIDLAGAGGMLAVGAIGWTLYTIVPGLARLAMTRLVSG